MYRLYISKMRFFLIPKKLLKGKEFFVFSELARLSSTFNPEVYWKFCNWSTKIENFLVVKSAWDSGSRQQARLGKHTNLYNCVGSLSNHLVRKKVFGIYHWIFLSNFLKILKCFLKFNFWNVICGDLWEHSFSSKKQIFNKIRNWRTVQFVDTFCFQFQRN